MTRKIVTLIGLFIEQRVSMKSHDHALQLYRMFLSRILVIEFYYLNCRSGIFSVKLII